MSKRKEGDNVMKFFEDVVTGFLGLRVPAGGPVLLDRDSSSGIESCESFEARDERTGAKPAGLQSRLRTEFAQPSYYDMPSPSGGLVITKKEKMSSRRLKVKRRVEEDFEMERELGRGHFGVVKACLDNKTGERFACKSIDKSKLKYWDDVEDVRREISAMKKLAGSPYVVNFHRAYEDEKHVHVVMELCEGGDLFEEMAKKGRLPEAEACTLFVEIVKAVAHCHAHSILHRDIKPENILLTNTCSPTSPLIHLSSHLLGQSPIKLADFGLSVALQGDKPVYGVAGSPFYLAPEVLSGGYSLSADIWSLGVVLFMMLSGTAPFGGNTEEEVLTCVRRGKFGFKHASWAAVSPQAKHLLRRMLHLSPAERPTAREVLQHPWFQEMGVPTEMIERCETASGHAGSELTGTPPLSPIVTAASSSSGGSESSGRDGASGSPALSKPGLVRRKKSLSPVSHLGAHSVFSPSVPRGLAAPSEDTPVKTPRAALRSPGLAPALSSSASECSLSAAFSSSCSSGELSQPGSPLAGADDGESFRLPASAASRVEEGLKTVPEVAFKASDPELAGQLLYVDWVFGF